ncbi:aminotransferase class IV [Candidatus Omnitrophota bacterium]
MKKSSLPDFDLIETLLWENGKYFLLDLHLKRLEKSAQYFSFSYTQDSVASALEDLTVSFDPTRKYRVRLLLEKSGKLNLTSGVLPPPDGSPASITISEERTDKNDIFLLHKTTNRTLYNRELTKWRAKGFFDVIFLNQETEVTEGALTNIIMQKGTAWWTPPLSSGLLGGVYREHLLKTEALPLKEQILHLEDLLHADRIFIINSVRKMVPAVLAK